MSGEWTLRVGSWTTRVEPGQVARLAALTLVVMALFVTALCYGGADWLSPSKALLALTGQGEDAVIVREWRLPRAVAAAAFGGALGLAGALLQNLTRNPLGSPDIVGLDAGAYTGTLIAMTMLSAGSALATGSAILGGLVAAGIVVLLSERAGLGGMRLIVTGIAVNAILTAVNAWLVLRADDEVALAATGWNAGSLNGIDAGRLTAPLIVLGLVAIGAVVLAAAVQQTTLGDDLARGTGVDLRRVRLGMLVLSVIAAAAVTAVAGPIAFIALAAPQIGRRVAGGAGTPLLPAVLMGAVLLLGSDLLAQALLAPESLPVGVVTTCVGGAYLIWLLISEVRRVRQ